MYIGKLEKILYDKYGYEIIDTSKSEGDLVFLCFNRFEDFKELRLGIDGKIRDGKEKILMELSEKEVSMLFRLL